MGIPKIAVFKVQVDNSELFEVAIVLVTEREDAGEGKTGRRGGRPGHWGGGGVVAAE